MTTLRWGSASETGRVRTINQDSSLEADPIFAVADGMGGHAGGEVASKVALEALRAGAAPTHDGLVEGIRLANRAVIDRAEDDPELRGMGTTLCAIALVGPDGDDDENGDERIVVANVGDSRVYLLQGGELLQVTEDHSLVEEMVRQGRLSPDEARIHPQKNIVTRVLGNEDDIEVDSWEITPHRGDRYLLCSDGLTGELDDDLTAAVLRRLADPGEAARELVRLAVEAGGRDNVTVVVVDVVDDGGRAEAASAAVAGGTADSPTVRRRGGTAMAAADLANLQGSDGGAVPTTATDATGGDAPSRFTWRSALFLLAVVAVVAGAVGSVAWFARSTYHVRIVDDEVVILQGRPGGVLWIQPTVVEPTGFPADDVPPARRHELEAGKEQPSLAAARRYVDNLEDQARSITTTTTSTTTTTTTTTEATTTTGAAP
ncbi:MAG TPA: PP2C family serine/threonine-protein phosphatase [Acidimicrobiales bacterium]|nr:PP2C family serine/threonine-protein phosphatase [Acidimicrobiales bacterium]